MAYFDSSKNRAKWEIELAALRRERMRRAQGTGNVQGPETGEAGQRPMVIRMTYQELLREEAQASHRGPGGNQPEMETEKARKIKGEIAYGKN